MSSEEKQDKVGYLQMIQEPICRMSTTSAIFKGFSATIVAGVSALSFKDMNIWILGLSFLPVVSFMLLDIYYLILERKYRYLFELVRKDEHEIDFSLNLTNDPMDLLKARAKISDCLKSPSIWLFYPWMITVLFIVFILKFKGVV